MSEWRDDPGQSAGVFVSGYLEYVAAGGSDCLRAARRCDLGPSRWHPKCSPIDGARCGTRDGWERTRPVRTIRIDLAWVSLHGSLPDVP